MAHRFTTQVQRQFSDESIIFSMVLHQLNTDKQKNNTNHTGFILCTLQKINLKWTISLNVNHKTEISRKKLR